MNVRAAHIVLIPLIAGLSACGDGPTSTAPRGEFTHRTSGPTSTASQPQASPDTPTAEPADSAATATPPQAAPETKIAELISTGIRNQPLATYEVPEKVRERLRAGDAKILPAPLPAKPGFTLFNQFIDISATSSLVKFTAVLRIDGQKDEVIELSCAIDKSQMPWTCTNMYPSDLRIARQKRLQGTFECLDTYSCDQAGVKVWVVINGKLQEPQTFQMRGFEARIASSGDADESDPQQPADEAKPVTKPALKGGDPADAHKPVVFEKHQDRVPDAKTGPAVAKVTLPQGTVPLPEKDHTLEKKQTPAADSDNRPALSAEEIDKALTDPSVALEITSPMNLPAPTQGKYSPAGIEKLYPEMGKGVANQAIGSHTRGHLSSAVELPASATGLVSRDHGSKDFGTNMTIDLLKKAAAAVSRKYPGRSAMVVANIAKRTGGTLLHQNGRAHASHKTGLDADVVLPANKGGRDMWNACALSGGRCVSGSRIADNLDEARFWLFIKQLSCARGSPVIAMFLDREIKAHMCQYARSIGERVNDPNSCAFKALQALYHEDGHYNHVHVRFKCPGNRDCQNSMVTLGKGSGC